ncbi:hypothetical protein PENTCL1PPCAC_12004, partial [Pristionchus entomophagus]
SMSIKPYSYEDIKKNIIDQVVNNRKNGIKRQSMDAPSTQGSAKRKPFFGKKQKKAAVKLYKVPECYTMPINGVHVSLPKGLIPYRTQKLMMVRILQAIIRSQNALAESPTGSGKTMALLASSCAWLKQYKEKRWKSKEDCPVHSSTEYKKMKEEEMSALLTQPADSKPPSMAESKFADDDEISVVYDKFDESMQKLTANIDDDFIPAKRQTSTKADDLAKQQMMMNEEMENFEGELTEEAKARREKCTCLPKVRVYYGTRTHKQIGQVVKEFGRLDYAPALSHTILGSREQMCINEGVRAHADLGGACKELISNEGQGCAYKTNMRGNYEKPFAIRQVIRSKGADVFDIDALVEALGEDDGPQLCPYFSATRILTQDADIIFCPFNYMIDPIIRDMSDVHLKDAVVILDEAHNVEDICRDAASFTFNEKEIHDALMSFTEKQELVRREIADQSKRLNEDEKEQGVDYIQRLRDFAKALNEMVNTMTSIRLWLISESEGVRDPRPNDRFDKGTATKGWEELYDSLERKSLIFGKDSQKTLKEAMMKLVEKDNAETKNWTMDSFKPNGTAMVCVEKFLYFILYFTKENRRRTYRLNITVERPSEMQLAAEAHHGMKRPGGTQPWGGSSGPRNQLYTSQPVMSSTTLTGIDLFNAYSASTFVDPKNMPTAFVPIRSGLRITAHMWCMSPELAYMDAFAECRTVVLASGTLCPTETLKTELGMPFVFEMEGEQVIPKEQIFASVIKRGENGTTLRATYQNSQNDMFLEELAMIIRSVARRVPGGVLIFFPSYRLLDRVYEWMHQATFIRQIEFNKIVVKEPKRSSDLTGVMSQYEAAIANPKSFGPGVTGSLMFAVFRGKVSEGIDFIDDMARCVVSIGIPYPNAMDELVQEKKKYNNENSQKLRILTGDQWYTSQAYRALNQALGRCLRHRGDWGSIVMVDERLAVPTHQPLLAASAASSAARVSRWIRDQTVNYDVYKEFEADLESFIERMTKPVVKMEIKEEMKKEID